MKAQHYKPILFSTEMVQAILAGRKTQTRRVIKEISDHYLQTLVLHAYGKYTFVENGNYNPQAEDIIEVHPQYKVGDILWVREAYTEIFRNRQDRIGLESVLRYKADNESSMKLFSGWTPSIHMPKEAARIFLKVTNVRVERLQDISEADAMAEGVNFHWYDEERNIKIQNAYSLFKELWQSINAKKASWKSNPWVWVYTFEITEKPENF